MCNKKPTLCSVKIAEEQRMEELSLQQYFRYEIEEKQRKDEFDNLLEDTAHRSKD